MPRAATRYYRFSFTDWAEFALSYLSASLYVLYYCLVLFARKLWAGVYRISIKSKLSIFAASQVIRDVRAKITLSLHRLLSPICELLLALVGAL